MSANEKDHDGDSGCGGGESNSLFGSPLMLALGGMCGCILGFVPKSMVSSLLRLKIPPLLVSRHFGVWPSGLEYGRGAGHLRISLRRHSGSWMP